MHRPGNCAARQQGKTPQFKPDLSSPNGVLRTLVSLANTSAQIPGPHDGAVRDGVTDIAGSVAAGEGLANLISSRMTRPSPARSRRPTLAQAGACILRSARGRGPCHPFGCARASPIPSVEASGQLLEFHEPGAER